MSWKHYRLLAWLIVALEGGQRPLVVVPSLAAKQRVIDDLPPQLVPLVDIEVL